VRLKGRIRMDKFLTKELPEKYGVHQYTISRWVKRLYPVLVERGVLVEEDRLTYKLWKVTDKEKFVKVFKEEVERCKSR